MELDYVYRSRLSELAPVGDTAWIDKDTLVVGFTSGLLEIVNVEERQLLSSTQLEGKIICAIAVVDSHRLVIQSRGDSVSLFTDASGTWKPEWTVSTKTAVSFSKPVLIELYVFFVSHGQSVIYVVDTVTGTTVTSVDVTTTVASGMVTSIDRVGDEAIVLTESGHIVVLSQTGGLVSTSHVTFKTDDTADSVVPSALAVKSSRECLVGYSNGTIHKHSVDSTIPLFSSPLKGGVGWIVVEADVTVMGTWKGNLYTAIRDGEPTAVRSPHVCSIVRIAGNGGTRLAVASTDGRVSVWDIAPHSSS